MEGGGNGEGREKGGVLLPSPYFFLDLAHGVKLVALPAEEQQFLAAAFTLFDGCLAGPEGRVSSLAFWRGRRQMASALVSPLPDIGRLFLHKRHSPLQPTVLRVREVLAIRWHAAGPRRQPHPLAQLALAGDGMAHRRRPRVHPVVLDDAVGADVGGELCDARDDEAEEDDADELEYEEEAAAGVGLRGEIAEADGEDGLRGVRRWERGGWGG